MTDPAQRTDLPTVIAIAALAGVVVTQLHEGAGHGGACLALGRHVREWGAFYLDCDTHTAPPIVGRLVAAAGSTMNLLTALLALGLLRATPGSRPRARFFWWLVAAVGGFEWAGYYLFSGVSGLGDWGASPDGVFNLVPGWPAWRLLLAVGGGVLYWLWAIVAMRALAGLTGADEAGRRQARLLSWVAYATIGGTAFAIGLMNPIGLFVLLASAVAASFGGTSGLMWAPYYIRPGATAAPPFAIARSWVWIVVGAAMIVAEGLILGPSLHF
ncbi:MAG TPA: hypothetical protein VK533_14180 [Sphingomonas sp.]|uniref:hypothetical protein n=1 Tax=Sphingomonas sp. TaxID=28214 RepID=UPI002CC4B422|nr:hypothetical protein [Sphingomonas sp.]HMI20680.1 hypothetical protein [Sphingomonas sp.]